MFGVNVKVAEAIVYLLLLSNSDCSLMHNFGERGVARNARINDIVLG
jgi:hypothetical protein